MKILVVRDPSQFSSQLSHMAEQRVEDIVTVPIAWRAIGSTVDLQRVIELQKPEYLLCAVRLAADSDKAEQKHYRNMVETLERAARKFALPLFFLSSASVFAGGKPGYVEGDVCEPVTDLGRLYLDMEHLLEKKLRRHLILRTSWVYSGRGENFLTSVIEYAADNELISINSAGKGCPTATVDLARVVLAMLLQVDIGINAWGVYHYASSDPALGFQFVEAIVAQASQYDERINAKQLLFEHNDGQAGPFYFEPVILKCQKIMEVFGIQQKPWRAMLPTVVKQYFGARIEEGGA